MISHTLFDDGEHRWIALVRDAAKPESVIDTNQYLIESRGEVLVLDPGGTEIFTSVVTALAEHVEIGQIYAIFGSHQDPDVLSSLPLWMGLAPDALIYLPWLWTGFVAHYGYDYVEQFIAVKDEGGPLTIGRRGRTVQMIPAHYCHSAGNFSMYDPHAKILFSGDIGAALLPTGAPLFVDDVERLIPAMEGFHRRWMPSNAAKNDWIARVRQMDVHMMCPQHGAIFRGEQVGQFLDWFEQLDVGSAIASNLQPA